MSRTRGSNLHRRLTVAWLGTDERTALAAALGADVVRIDRTRLDELAAPAADRRRELEAVTDTALEEELRSLDGRRRSAELALEDLVTEQRRLRDAADWCELQPESEDAAVTQIETVTADLERHSRVAREATRQLERVLEQRAAAEAALEEARRELSGLGATGIDESDVRREMEAASHDLSAATTAYQEAMKDVARRRAAVAEVEAVATRTEQPVVPKIDDGDQLQAMGRALRAKFDPAADDAEGASAGDVEQARAELRRAEERADDAANALAIVRRRIDGFETELAARSNDGNARDARHDAAVALETQVSSVERQLTEAEAIARTEVDDATRSMSRAELVLERLRQERRDRRRKLGELVGLVPAAERPSADEDLVHHAGTIAQSLRTLVEPMQDDVERATDAARSLRAEHEEKAAELERRRAGRHALLSEDRRTALQLLLDDEPGVVALVDAVAVDDGDLLLVDDLDALETPCPVVVLTGDGAVAGWAIELPYERGRLANGSELWSLTDHGVASHSTTTDQQPAQTTCR